MMWTITSLTWHLLWLFCVEQPEKALFWIDGSLILTQNWNLLGFLMSSDFSLFLCFIYSPGSGNFSQLGSTPQISLPYSAMVRSELNLPLEATFMMAILAHKSWFWKNHGKRNLMHKRKNNARGCPQKGFDILKGIFGKYF